ncbi:hypothetical protein TNCV_1669451 [Trichonephila clavipes]|nr:hypothetical protein TNCV_1669451 [Trichonephila clavipes]
MAWRVIGRLESEQIQRSVADAVEVARSVVARLWNRFQETGNGGLYARRPMVCIPLTPRHRVARRRWAAEHRDWEQHDWSQVLFYRRVPIQSRV